MKTNLISYSFEELVAAEKAASVVRRAYEDKVMMMRGYGEQGDEMAELSKKLSLVNATRLKIINEMEKRLLEIEQ